MNKIIFPLEPHMRGAGVADLQEGLWLCLDNGVFQLSDAERQAFQDRLHAERVENIYADTTQNLVGVFQEQHQLQPGGSVDEPTAKALNATLEQLGAFSPAAPDQQRLVGGQVRRADNQPFPGVIVRAFDVLDDRGVLRLGEDTTDAEGHYTIRYAILPGVDAIDLRVVVFDTNGKPLRDSDVIREAKPLEIVDLIVPGVDIASYRVEGKVASRISASVGGLRVVIVDKGVGGDVPLAETSTNEGGAYQVTFSDSDVRLRGKVQPDLQARVFAGETFSGASDVRYNASQHETLNVLLEDKAASALRSEHEVLTSALASQFKGRLGDLKETDDQQDITYLANKTGWDARAVALAALADQFSQHSMDGSGAAEIHPAFYYALFRAGLPANEDTLYHADTGTLTAVWKQAAEQGVLPASLTEAIPKAVEQFQVLSQQKLLSSPAIVGVSSLKEMLATSGLDDEDQQQKFAKLYVEYQADMLKFWEAVGGAFDPAIAMRLQVEGKLGFLTINNAPLMQALHKEVGGNGLSNLLQLAQSGYHQAEPWNQLLTDAVPIPKEIPGDNIEMMRANYANYLAAQVRLSYPTAAVAQMVKSGALPLTGAANGVSDKVHAFLTEHQGEFEIGVQPVQQYIAQNSVQVADETVGQVKRLQRVYQITPSDQAMTGLMKHGIDTAYHVVRYDKDTFVQSFAEDLGGAEIAEQTYDKSVQVHNAVLNIAISYLTAKNGIGLGATPLNAPQQGSDATGQILQPAPKGPPVIKAEEMIAVNQGAVVAANASDVIAYPTLEGLFGEMDFCACDHCRSILSPAAYLVDLLQFIDLRRYNSQGDELPHTYKEENPLDVLLERRPDVQHLPLTCENTNIALPYIDVVNETLEYFVTTATLNTTQNPPKPPMDGYIGHDTNDVASEDLLASPQFVIDLAYTALQGERFPAPLPFHQPLESLRRYFKKFEVPLPLAMERLRKTNDLERNADPYGWRDILMEEIGLSRDEYDLLTTSNAAPNVLEQIYGFPAGTTDADVIAGLSNAKPFTRRVGISYEDIVALLRTRFVNPNSDLIPKLDRLGVPFATLKALKVGTITDAAFDALLRTGAPAPNPAEYGGDIKAWVKRQDNYDRIMAIITLTDPTASPDSCSFDNLEFRYSKPMTDVDDTSTRLSAVEFVRLLRFIRLWKKLGWTIQETDAAICALYKEDLTSLGVGDIAFVSDLDTGFKTLLPRLGVAVRVMNALNLTVKRDLLLLLACWSDIGTHGDSALYRQMFLNPALLKQDAVFANNVYGRFLADNTKNLADHAEALRSAFNLTGDEYDGIVDALGYDATTPLTISNISAVYRRGYLAHKLRLSVRELLLLTSLTSLDPFAAPDLTNPAILQIIALVQALKDRSLKSVAALYLIWNQNLSGKSAPDPAQITEFARTLRGDFASIENQFAVTEDPGGDIARVRMALVYGNDATNLFFGFLDNTFVTDVQYSHTALVFVTKVAYTHNHTTLEQAILDAAPHQIAYDDTTKTLAFTGILTDIVCNALKKIAGVTDDFKNAVDALYTENRKVVQANLEQPIVDSAPGRIYYDDFRKRLFFSGILTDHILDTLMNVQVNGAPLSQEFKDALHNLYQENQKVVVPFFARYSELQSLYDAYVSDTTHSVADKRATLLKAILPELVQRWKRQQALQSVSAVTNTDLAFTQALLDPPATPFPLHAVGHGDQPALNDLLALETSGLSVQFFANDTATGAIILAPDIASNLDYAPAVGGDGNPLPAHPTPGAAISGVWRGYIEAPESGFFNLRIEVDAGALVTLILDGKPVTLTQNAMLWNNVDPLELRAGTLYSINLTVEKVRNVVRLAWDWQPKGQGRAVIPARYLYPAGLFERFQETYVRFLKAGSLVTGLGLTANEMAHFATHADYRINAQGQIDSSGQGWLNALPNADNLHLANPTDATIARNLNAALLTPLHALLDFARIKADISPGDESLLTALKDPITTTRNSDSLLLIITRWNQTSLNDVLTRFGGNIAGLEHFDLFLRVHDAFALIQKMGISADALIQATTNNPTSKTVRDLQAALCARYDAANWRDVVQPINDAMRGLQRDALVAYILHQMRSNPANAHIDTADKLFEYFLMDVQMEPCMQTSRIRHALSSVQLFIERCLMNLEPRVSPSSINATQWEWMKRYRVWEANRKVFLFPENWLEPELRDDKSPFFKEIESELLQSDITEDSAATALLNYLSKLEEVAKLEPCGIYHIPADSSKRTGAISHIIARTAGAHRKYYYRRYEYGYWTPWEQIKLDIEDNPVIPVIWKGRLLLFWLRILKQAPLDVQKPGSGDIALTSLRTSDIKTDAMKVTVQAVLCWSEYYNGKWQPTKTSDIDRPIKLDDFVLAGETAFDRSQLRLGVFEERIPLLEDTEQGDVLRVGVFGNGYSSSFLLYNTHSLPIGRDDAPQTVSKPSLQRRGWRYLNREEGILYISYDTKFKHNLTPLRREVVLKDSIPFATVEPLHPLQDVWGAPFFFEDSLHVFFVTTTERQVPISDHPGYGVVVNPGFKQMVNIAPLVLKTDPRKDVGPKFWGDGGPIGPDPGVIDPAPMQRFVTEDAYIRQGIGTSGSVTYGDHQIGPSGAISNGRAKI